jgi:hypothetical protein
MSRVSGLGGVGELGQLRVQSGGPRVDGEQQGRAAPDRVQADGGVGEPDTAARVRWRRQAAAAQSAEDEAGDGGGLALEVGEETRRRRTWRKGGARGREAGEEQGRHGGGGSVGKGSGWRRVYRGSILRWEAGICRPPSHDACLLNDKPNGSTAVLGLPWPLTLPVPLSEY